MRMQTRMALLFGAVVIATAFLMGALSYLAMESRLQAQVDTSLIEVSAPLARDLASGQRPREVSDRGGREGRGGPGQGQLVLPTQVLLPDGRVLADPEDISIPVDDEDIAIAGSMSPTTRFDDVTIDDRPYRSVTQTAGGARGAVQVARDVSENERVLTSLAWVLAAIGVVVATLAAAAGWFVARRTSRRLVALTDAAESVTATGQLGAAVPASGSDEVSRLGTAFNAMLARLSQSRDDQQRLVQDAGHELRTPLTSLRTNVSLLRQFDDMPTDTRARVITDLDGETRELTALVNEVVTLAAAAPNDAPREPVSLADLAREAGERAHRRSGCEVTLHLDDSVVRGQSALLARAMWNLVENACKFSGDDPQVDVVVRQGTVVVRDRGPGITAADLPHVFDRFFRATSARSLPGSGLGLAIVSDVAMAHGGRTFASNRAGGGAEVGFQIPVLSET